MELFIISDIHGRYFEFMELLEFAGFDSTQDYLINLGDMVDRGPNSYDVVEWFRQMNVATGGRVQTIFGNHEHLLLSYKAGHVPEKDYFNKFIGGKSCIESYVDENSLAKHLSWISELPKYITIDNYVFVHASVDLTKPIQKQNISDLAWDYKKFYTQDTSGVNCIFVYGHTPTEYIYKYYGLKGSEIWKKDNQICIDCTYSKSRKLLLYDLVNNIEYYYSFARKCCYKVEDRGYTY